MDKLKKKWSALAKKLGDDNKEVQKNVRKAFATQPQAFRGQAHTLSSQSTAAQAAQAPQPPQQARPARPPSAASNAAAQAALARFDKKNAPPKGAAPKTKPLWGGSGAPPPGYLGAPAPLPRPAAAPTQAREPVDVEAVVGAIEDDVLAACIAQLAADDRFAASGDVLLRVCRNIALHPGEAKYRRLRLSNAKVQSAVVDTEGAIELLQGCGFGLHFESVEGQEEGFLIFPEDADLSRLTAAVDVLQKLLPGSAPPPPPRNLAICPMGPGPGNRFTAVLLPIETDACVPDWFFESTGAELKAVYAAAVKKRQQGETLMTRAMREKLAVGDNKATYSSARIRVRLPEGLLLQGLFGAREAVSAISEWVSESLARPDLTYELLLPDRRPLQPGMGSIGDADLPPAALLNFRWTDERKGEAANKPTLTPELLALAKPASDDSY